DENSSRDVGMFVRNCDLVRMEASLHLCAVHHLGKDESRGARGHSLLKAAIDTEITVTRQGWNGAIEITKQRDYPDGDRFGFAINPVDLDNGRTSFVVVEGDPPSRTTRETKLTPNQQTMYSILRDSGQAGLTTEQWNVRAKQMGIGTKRPATLYDIRMSLKQRELVREFNDRWTAAT